jgi:hypothetical protein
LPANGWEHASSHKVYTDYARLEIQSTDKLADDQLCFIFSRRRDEEVVTEGNACVCDCDVKKFKKKFLLIFSSKFSFKNRNFYFS